MAIWMHMNTLSMYVCVCILPSSVVKDIDIDICMYIYICINEVPCYRDLYIHHLCLKGNMRRLHVAT